MTEKTQEPLDFLKSMWGNMGFPLPGMVAPTVDTDELDRRIADLKAVEGWLRSNLSMLQMTIQGLEMQKNTLATMQAISQSAGGADANPFANPALWPWNFMQQATPGMPPAGAEATPAPPAKEAAPSAGKGKPKG
ncbi:MAG: hypothetical protein KJ787_01615 [Gammaproteobacteria bacterium]|nr:hypothetical protein [Gammaproteobacteria bacterium]MBU1645013.1 hypothetical protein [Gammaproteobacteria bacterium]MBU1971212.1 hypothetical protein [Gammaproteobacteria bacterium]